MQQMDLRELKMQYGIVGRDEKLDRVLDTALQVARTNLSVLIQGESGVGKEVIPRIIHNHSLRKGRPYIAINCGSIPEGTIDSELFGHVKGSFTGAIADHEGYFGAANGGTLFLDEVGELPLSTQVRLLRVLETGEYVSVGSNQPKKTDVRIVAATNVQMEQAIREGRFREDLYYRLCTISIKMPALRERGDDVLLLWRKFAMDTAREYQIPEPLRLSPEAERVVKAYKWPGNIRQFKNVVEQMSILSDDRLVTPEVLAEYDIVPSSDSREVRYNRTSAEEQSLEQTLELMKYAI
ncbi:MAG: sigma-54 dependent transcriptional regulator, partial [Bacteroidaceae bacterium]|nr:sigma-54 dependent transcriptional regulator [Bacteroidaceae bacterium]